MTNGFLLKWDQSLGANPSPRIQLVRCIRGNDVACLPKLAMCQFYFPSTLEKSVASRSLPASAINFR